MSGRAVQQARCDALILSTSKQADAARDGCLCDQQVAPPMHSKACDWNCCEHPLSPKCVCQMFQRDAVCFTTSERPTVCFNVEKSRHSV
eukprot:6472330-Amphidinium_carterae.2